MYQIWIVILLFLSATTPAHAAISFVIEEPVISSNELSVTASISGLSTTSCDSTGKCYLQGTLRQVGASKYFGQTQNNVATWVDYLSEPSVEYIQSTFMSFVPIDGSWGGIVRIRFAPDDSDYHGPGDYELKLRRFTGKSSGAAGDSNTLVVALTPAKPTPTPSPIPSPTPTPPPSPTPSPTPTPTPVQPSPTPTPKPSPKSSPSPDFSSASEGTVAGVTTQIDLSGFGGIASPSPTGEPSLRGSSSQGLTLNKSRAKTALTLGSGILLITLSTFFGYRKYRAIMTP